LITVQFENDLLGNGIAIGEYAISIMKFAIAHRTRIELCNFKRFIVGFWFYKCAACRFCFACFVDVLTRATLNNFNPDFEDAAFFIGLRSANDGRG